MPTLGSPQSLTRNNPYRNVKKHRPMSKGDFLNKISGRNDLSEDRGVRVVDGDKHGKLGKEGFMKLLMHQLSNQDPIKPIDQNKMSADLVRLSQLEQMSNMNKNLKKSLLDDTVKRKFFAASFLGKIAMSQGASLNYRGGESTPMIHFRTSQDVAKGLVRIFDHRKQMVSQFDFGERSRGIHSIPWEARHLDGMRAKKGIYTFQVMARDEGGQKVLVETHAEGLVTGVSFDKHGETVLTIDGKKVYLRDVEHFRLKKGEGSYEHSEIF